MFLSHPRKPCVGTCGVWRARSQRAVSAQVLLAVAGQLPGSACSFPSVDLKPVAALAFRGRASLPLPVPLSRHRSCSAPWFAPSARSYNQTPLCLGIAWLFSAVSAYTCFNLFVSSTHGIASAVPEQVDRLLWEGPTVNMPALRVPRPPRPPRPWVVKNCLLFPALGL